MKKVLHSRTKNLMDVQDFLKSTYRLALDMENQTQIRKEVSATFPLQRKIKIRISEGYSSHRDLHTARKEENQIQLLL